MDFPPTIWRWYISDKLAGAQEMRSEPRGPLKGNHKGRRGGVIATFSTEHHSVVQWHPFSPFLVAAPLKMVFPKKGSRFFAGSPNN